MKKISDYIVKLRYVILALGFLLLIPSAIGFFSTKINYDILYYLPKDIETMKGQDVLMDDFGKGAYGILVTDGLETKDRIILAEKMEKVPHVADVISFDKISNGEIPAEMLPADFRKVFFSEDKQKSLMFIFFDTTSSADETMEAIKELRTVAGKQCFLSSMSSIVTDTKQMVEDQVVIYTIIAVVLAIIILLLTTDSYLVPILFLISIGMTIIYNLGTNIIQGEISFITMALVAILQLGVTMDYSIFLYHSYEECRQKFDDSKQAMSEAIRATILSVTGSSLTTIAGFLAMCFMTFTLGMDMGIVMAKGVVLGVIGCITLLPSFILVFEKQIEKTKHRAVTIKSKKLSEFVVKNRLVIAIAMLLLWIPAILGYKNVNVYYKLDQSLPEYLPSVQANEKLNDNFELSSVSMILIDSKVSSKDIRNMCDEINNLEGVSFALGMSEISGPMVPDEFLGNVGKGVLESENWKLLMVSSSYQVATDEVGAQCEKISEIVKRYDPNGMLIGEAPATKDLVDITDRDFFVVSVVSIGAIFILILIVLRSISLPVILVLVIELAIYLNMGCAFFTNTTLPFIASVCVGTIQLGATVDYAILLTNRYLKERRGGEDKKAAAKIALDSSVQSIFASALGFFAATVGVAIYSDVDLIASICMLLARGAIMSMIIVIVILPAMLVVFDKLIVKTTMNMKMCK